MTTLQHEKVNKQHILDIVRMEPVWPQAEGKDEKEIHYYHITDALNRKWQTIGYNVSDAIEVFQHDKNNVWTRIIESAPFNPKLDTCNLIQMLHISSEDEHIRNAMQIILNSVERRNEFIARSMYINEQDTFKLLCNMKGEYLRYQQLTDKKFMELYAANPVEALSVYFLESVDIHLYWEWVEAGGTCKKAIQYKQSTPEMTLIQAIERAEEEVDCHVFGY
ncbi:hypothetical protein UY416_11015 [Paenibacillus polymyxa]|uniref:hypothetical protein n=1 Tax=Paenibacillus polymyxa TaxID=1406 RepID=UPI002AB3A20E|nr:hypothetical protein [Paenibacillus polymyxa]MDY8046826.1 hypothetical protein [Paenibacillus polymyxa]